jgi:hypothetical protein
MLGVIEKIKKDKNSTLILAPNETTELLDLLQKIRKKEERKTIKSLTKNAKL